MNKSSPEGPVGPEQYRCVSCGGVFDKGWSDEEAEKEYAERFPTFDGEPREIICDDCFKIFEKNILG